jgi:monothiol glutaredoxin
MTTTPIAERITQEITTHDVVLYMKGTKKLPQCGFSATVAGIFERLGVSVHDVNILLDPELRQGIKEFSDWPTIPQLYVKGEFIGGSDIVREMYESGELQALLSEHHISHHASA